MLPPPLAAESVDASSLLDCLSTDSADERLGHAQTAVIEYK